MAKFKTIYSPNSSFGGTSFRATSDGETVNIQRRIQGNRSYRTDGTITKAQFDEWANRFDVFNPFNDNPCYISCLSTALEGGDGFASAMNPDDEY